MSAYVISLCRTTDSGNTIGRGEEKENRFDIKIIAYMGGIWTKGFIM